MIVPAPRPILTSHIPKALDSDILHEISPHPGQTDDCQCMQTIGAGFGSSTSDKLCH